jgi:Brf1-like TBP-binding domain
MMVKSVKSSSQMSSNALVSTDASDACGLNLNVCEELSDMSEEESSLLILSNEEHTVKSILWHSMNEKWLRE